MKSDISKLNTIFQYAIQNERCSLYKDLYKNIPVDTIESLDDWRKLPFFEKDMIRSIPFEERLFVPYRNLDSFKTTSGTSGKSAVVFPRTSHSSYKHNVSPEKKFTCILHFLNPQHFFANSKNEEALNETNIIGGDLSNLEASVAIASKAGLDCLVGLVSVVEILIPILEKYSLTNKIKQINLGGERATEKQIKRIKEKFPNAHIRATYHSVELQSTIATAESVSDNAQHEIVDHFYWELINDGGNVLSQIGDEGEIVVTQLYSNNNPLPFLRYRTGDFGQIKAFDHRDLPIVQPLGRIELDKIKIPGGIIQLREIERAVEGLHPSLTDDFQLHFSHVDQAGNLLVKIEIHIKVSEGSRFPTPSLTEELAKKLSGRIRVAPYYVYANGVSAGVYAPLTLKCVEKIIPKNPKNPKTVRFFQH